MVYYISWENIGEMNDSLGAWKYCSINKLYHKMMQIDDLECNKMKCDEFLCLQQFSVSWCLFETNMAGRFYQINSVNKEISRDINVFNLQSTYG